MLVPDEQKTRLTHVLSSAWPVGVATQLMPRMLSESVFVLVQRLAKDWLTHALSSTWLVGGRGEADVENAEWAGLWAGTRLAEDQPIHALSYMLLLLLLRQRSGVVIF